MKTIFIPIEMYSELTIRKSLYWCSPEGNWTLRASENEWLIEVQTSSNLFESTLHRHLNDFHLRERLDNKTLIKRQQIIEAALNAVSNGL